MQSLGAHELNGAAARPAAARAPLRQRSDD